MIENCLLDQLKRLKTSSKESVENLESFSNFKKHMHVKRDVEEELYKLIFNSNNSISPKLILVCGSVGDGKSHLISYMKENNNDLIKNFKLHNDATESFDPEKLCIDTLNEELNDFSDERLSENHNEKMILAINLGTLSNFIDSKYGDRYTLLKQFVEDKKILDMNVEDYSYNEDEPFQYVNFSDYHMYSLTEEGPKSDYMRNIINKVVVKSDENPFYMAYNNGCDNCNYKDQCPIKYNYEFLQRDDVQEKITKLLIKGIITNKAIISTRALLDFIYSILVDVRFDNISRTKLKNILKNLEDKDYIDCMLPSILFTENDTSTIINILTKTDPLNSRNEYVDELVINLNNTQNLLQFFIDNMDIENDFKLKEILDANKNMPNREMKNALIKYFFRLYTFNGKESIANEKLYNEFCRLLYYWNVGDRKNIKELNKKIMESIYLWNGQADRDEININLGKKQSKYKVSQELELRPGKNEFKESDEKEILKFISEFLLNFEDRITDNKAQVSIDYKLYELLSKVRNGYRPNKKERTEYINFSEFINKITDIENRDDQIMFSCNMGKDNKKFVLEVDYDGDFRFVER
ncbi:DNA phosphorothioation-dependent restriction protein DptF [Anaeromicrobium sediminis]|uniref:DNA phosphorothioation-dependent restriction protein DptF n=1 Tax=Anaeromicrobium sediminis TaxID=1478221 RepID=A0A267MNN5_9FIRM|nr:DNA phosphorothioation-dependent restriction protein DptF [Anaeromicrobium sediminis]PAB60528.1 DNA phosphorothioation-dependent restriction protein DptF [Anaeromicrobium sediminis]